VFVTKSENFVKSLSRLCVIHYKADHLHEHNNRAGKTLAEKKKKKQFITNVLHNNETLRMYVEMNLTVPGLCNV
jgi:hypothetical protein